MKKYFACFFLAKNAANDGGTYLNPFSRFLRLFHATNNVSPGNYAGSGNCL